MRLPFLRLQLLTLVIIAAVVLGGLPSLAQATTKLSSPPESQPKWPGHVVCQHESSTGSYVDPFLLRHDRLGIGAVDAPITHHAYDPEPARTAAHQFVATKAGDKARDKRNTPDRGALIDIADEADKRRGGVTPGEAEILKDWGKELGVPVRGPEAHPGRGHGAKEHIHVGPKNHIPVKR